KMSGEEKTLKLKKCILSKLWYTSLIIYQRNSDKSIFSQYNNDAIDFVESDTLITDLIDSQTENQHRWITYTLLHKLFNNICRETTYRETTKHIEKHVEKQQNYIQMIYALQLYKNVTIHLQQELLMIYKNILQQINSVDFEKIQNKYFILLKQNVYNNPFVTCWILNEFLLTYSETSANIICTLQDFYFLLIKELMEFELSKQKLISDNYFGCILCIMSKMNIVKFNDSTLSEWFFPMILKTKNIQDIEFALYSRTNNQFFKKWCSFLSEFYVHSKFNNLNHILKIRKILFHFSSISAPTLNKNNLIQRINNTKLHWITDILDMCYILMINELYDDVSLILSCTLLKPFWPALLFKVLYEYSQEEMLLNNTEKDFNFICNSVKFLIPKCNFDVLCDPTLNELQNILRKNVKILKYILSVIKDVKTDDLNHIQVGGEIPPKTTNIEQKILTKRIFDLLQHFDTLLVLKMTTNICEQNCEKVRNLLKDICEPENVFIAYYSVLSALKAILLSNNYDTKQSIISKHFSDMDHYIKILFPLNLRMQIIENIFCLLFLRHEDFDHIKNYDTHEQLKLENKMMKQQLGDFICNKYVVRDILFHLVDIMSATEITFREIKSKNEYTEEIEQIQKNIASINAAILDAKWRLELYTTSEFTKNIDIKDENKNYSSKFKTKHLLDGKLISNRPTENIFFYQEGNILDETKTRSNSSSESELVHNTKWRKRSKNVSLTDDKITKDVTHKPLFVNFMLATKESLIIRCLWKNDYAKAQDIIEMYNMKNTQLNGELQFSKALRAFRENVYQQADTFKNENQFPENLQSSTLENIRLVTQESINSSRQTSQFETFLVSQEMNLRILSMEILNDNEILTICALDLAITMSQMYPISQNLCEIAMKYLKLCKTFDNTEYVYFFHKFCQLLYEKKDIVSIEDILCDAKIALCIKECKEKDIFWTDIMINHYEFKESQANKDTINRILKDSNYLSGLKILSKIITVAYASKTYMQNMYSHLQLLHSIIPTEHTIFTISDLLKIPLHYYFGYQIFELKVEPQKLEAIAHDLQINLSYSILTNACPKFLYEEDTSYIITNKENGCIVLNKALNKTDLSYKLEGPNQCVSEILSEILQILHNLNLNQSRLNPDICKTISNYSEIQTVLRKTSRLASLDLSELSMGDETLIFLLNTWNLMFLHTTLIVWRNYPPFNSLQHAISLMSIGYLIGDLGLVTLAALRSKLLNNIMLDNKFFMQVEELNEPAWQDLDIIHDPRVIFVMANEFLGTPRIQVYNTKSLDEDLTNAFYEYLNYYSCEKSNLSTEKQKIMLPKIVEQYQISISQSLKNNSSSNNRTLFSINDYFKSFNEDVIIEYMPLSYSYNVILKYLNYSNTYHHKQINQCKISWKNYSIRSNLLHYLESQCWVVSYLLQRINNENPTILKNSCDNLKRTACLENLLTSKEAKELKLLFDNNQTLAVIFEAISTQKLWSHFEFMLKEDEWDSCLRLVNALPAHITLNSELQCFKDKVLSHIISKQNTAFNTQILEYLYQIKDVYILSQTVLYNVNKWHINICENALLYTVHHVDNYRLPIHCKSQLNEMLHRVLIFHKMLPYCIIKSNETWYDIAYCTETINPLQIIKSLINADKFELCLEWMECQAFSLEIHPSVTQDFLIGLLRNESQNFKQTLKALPLDQSVKLCKTVLKKLESIDSLRFICTYLLQYCKATETIKYRQTLLGIDILSMLSIQERPLYIHLIKEPLLMLEQLLMNCKFESIQRILNKIQKKLDQTNITRSDFDRIIRFYAQKSLDCRVSLQCESIENKSKNIQHSASEIENAEFIMPIVVPTKEQWIPNDKARKCSCCKNVIFSMFNRRHHCRRCGRVICATCSQHRMQVSGYPPSVLVRVCNDCKQQTTLQMHTFQGTQSTSSSEIFDCWRLTRDQKHNETIREEFSFEYAPNISLCLAILNLHSEHQTYISFLLDCCDEMKRLLQPVSGGKANPEVDHMVIIKMIRSLLVAAKVKCAKLGLNTGLVHCDRFLSQVDLIASLVQFDCLHLIPSDNLHDRTLRKLRDLLIEKEQWTLALDVSTKAGLDTQGVWASWGKACLKMGYFDQAREKFFHCLDKIQSENFDDWVILSYPKESEIPSKSGTQKLINENDKNKEIKMDKLNSKKTEFSKYRPLKDPPLLIDILQILDNLSIYKQYVQIPHQYKFSVSQEMLNFESFKISSQRQLSDLNAKVTFLLDAQKHLESELQIETLNHKKKRRGSVHSNQGILTMEMEPSEIDKHINTISRQMEITKFLTNCEKEGRAPIQFLILFPKKDFNSSSNLEIPTLFGDQQQKINLAVLAILCGQNIEEGFGIAFRIMQDYNLPQQKVYSLTGHILAVKNNISAIEQLIKCCHTSGIANSYIISDHVLTHCVKLLLTHLHDETNSLLKNDIYNLIKLITNIDLKINAYIECKQLKAAYLLAVKYSRAQDIKKILKESDRLGQNAIKAICMKWLQQEPKL
ncbi:unnamed protein product, partial [Heterotrigona itama]